MELFVLHGDIGVSDTPVSILSLCFPQPLSPGALYLHSQALFPPQGLLWLVSSLSRIMAGVCFCSAAQKLLEVSVYKQRDVWDHIWIQQQTPGVFYTDYGNDFVLLLPCPLAQYPSGSVFHKARAFPSSSALSGLTPSRYYARQTTPHWADMHRLTD